MRHYTKQDRVMPGVGCTVINNNSLYECIAVKVTKFCLVWVRYRNQKGLLQIILWEIECDIRNKKVEISS